jgi:hypothetical protein
VDNKIPYNKKLNGGKQWGSGGPRDIQRKQNSAYGSAVIQLPKMSVKELKELLGGVSAIDKNGSGQITFEEVKRKIDEAIQFTIKQEKGRYESGLKNLNDQLNVMRKKAGSVEEQLIEKNAEIRRLKDQIISGPQDLNSKVEEKNNEINILKVKVEEKDKVIEKLSDNYTKNINMLGDKIDEIDSKLSRGILTTGEYKGDPDRPKIEDGIFIDPIESDNLELDPHIEIKADDVSRTKVTRDIKEDLDKLRHLLNKSKDSLVEEINTD